MSPTIRRLDGALPPLWTLVLASPDTYIAGTLTYEQLVSLKVQAEIAMDHRKKEIAEALKREDDEP